MVKVAIVTGSNKGIGFAIVKGLLKRFDGVVYLTSRDNDRGRAAVAKLNELGLKPEYHQLDVSDRKSIIRLRDHIKEKYGGIDVLINNAAVANTNSIYSNSYEESKYTVDINYYSILTIEELLFPLVRDNGRILNISSDGGHLSNIRNEYWIKILSKEDLNENDINEFVNWYLEETKNGIFDLNNLAEGTLPAYRIAKVALSAKTMLQQKKLEPRNISVNSMHPGWVKTDMTQGMGFYDVDQAAETPIYLVLDAPQSLKGAYVWYDRKVLDWYDYKADYYFKMTTLMAEKTKLQSK